VRRRWALTWALAGVAVAVAACARPAPSAPDEAAAQGAALRRLFFEREHAGRLVVWDDPVDAGPAFEALGSGRGAPAATAALARAVGAPVTTVRSVDLQRLFRDHPDGWAAFYSAYPRSAGLVEIGRVERTGAGVAQVVVGRACGEQCRNAWRVALRTDDAGRWRATAVTPLRVPR
jgi:hypothetical protein